MIDHLSFGDELVASLQSVMQCEDVNEQVEYLNRSICGPLDGICPVSIRMRKDRPYGPWYDGNIHFLQRMKRKSERKWRKSNDIIYHDQ